MSKKNVNNQASTENPSRRSSLIAVAVAVLVIAVVAATLTYLGEDTQPAPNGDMARQAALASEHSPTLGDANAKVHIVEFLDPACETCALFFPMVKNWMKEVPGQIRLRHHAHVGRGAGHVSGRVENGVDRLVQRIPVLVAATFLKMVLVVVQDSS